MQVYFSSLEGHNPEFELFNGHLVEHPETNQRTKIIVEELQKYPYFSLNEVPLTKVNLETVHSRSYIEFLKSKSQLIDQHDYIPSPIHSQSKIGSIDPFIHDTYTPVTSTTFTIAEQSASVALKAAEEIKNGNQNAYAICRPPGHHAGSDFAMGYCYFNNIALAAEHLISLGNIAILDLDYHHGNGTQEIFYKRKDVLVASIHAHPACRFPYSTGYSFEKGKGLGEGFNFNYPLMLDTDAYHYLNVLEKTLININNFKPKYLLVSLGVDTHKLDPIGGLGLDFVHFSIIGKMIKDLHLPILFIQEGGYNIATLGKLVMSLLSGFEEVA